MNFEKIRIIDHYLQRKQTGNPSDFAAKLNISKSMLFRYMKFIKTELNAPISYNSVKQSYQYDEAGELTINKWKQKTENIQ